MAEEQRFESFYNNLNVKCEVICSIDIARILLIEYQKKTAEQVTFIRKHYIFWTHPDINTARADI